MREAGTTRLLLTYTTLSLTFLATLVVLHLCFLATLEAPLSPSLGGPELRGCRLTYTTLILTFLAAVVVSPLLFGYAC